MIMKEFIKVIKILVIIIEITYNTLKILRRHNFPWVDLARTSLGLTRSV